MNKFLIQYHAQQKAQDIMSAPAVTVFEDIPVSEIVNLFSSKSVNRVPAVDSRGILIGVVVRADILQCVFPASPDQCISAFR